MSNRFFICVSGQFGFIIRHKSGVDKKVPDALSRRYALLATLKSEIITFVHLEDLYEKDEDYGEIWKTCMTHYTEGFYIVVGDLERESTMLTKAFIETGCSYYTWKRA